MAARERVTEVAVLKAIGAGTLLVERPSPEQLLPAIVEAENGGNSPLPKSHFWVDSVACLFCPGA